MRTCLSVENHSIQFILALKGHETRCMERVCPAPSPLKYHRSSFMPSDKRERQIKYAEFRPALSPSKISPEGFNVSTLGHNIMPSMWSFALDPLSFEKLWATINVLLCPLCSKRKRRTICALRAWRLKRSPRDCMRFITWVCDLQCSSLKKSKRVSTHMLCERGGVPEFQKKLVSKVCVCDLLRNPFKSMHVSCGPCLSKSV